ncbi:hypothetical protein GOP47_0018940 [Adiantum capillus-veneris]|uniref:Uncharacterized protein n=1 Tax=Adiantum capillus-veneris TaxID=13818 RepID=A0A9D4UFJ4_ADICA|nr:hypothetical protein GOP47_0018940 [Adiantum capillus-veneris]
MAALTTSSLVSLFSLIPRPIPAHRQPISLATRSQPVTPSLLTTNPSTRPSSALSTPPTTLPSPCQPRCQPLPSSSSTLNMSLSLAISPSTGRRPERSKAHPTDAGACRVTVRKENIPWKQMASYNFWLQAFYEYHCQMAVYLYGGNS